MVDQCRVVDLDEMVMVRLVASHFLWAQVRRMVGALVAVGRGEAPPEAVLEWLSGGAVRPFEAAPAAGLFLEKVLYPGEPEELPPLVPVGVPWFGRPQVKREPAEPAGTGGRRSGGRVGRRPRRRAG